jgi:hypothetical protein
MRVLGMAAAMLAGGLMVHTTAHAQDATAKAKAKVAESTNAAQPPSEVYGGMLKRLSEQVVGAAEAMPADKYDFVPTAGKFRPERCTGRCQTKSSEEQGRAGPGA